MSRQSDFIRTEWKKSDAQRDKGLSPPKNVVRFTDIPYGPAAEQKLDVYRPTGAGQPFPVIAVVHGGAWVYGDKELYQFYAMSLVQFGFAVVNFSYRLAPESKFPAQLEDINLVMQFIIENAGRYGFDSPNVFAAGDSAGAHLLSLYAGFLTDRTFQCQLPFLVPECNGKLFRLKGIALNCGSYIFKDKSRINSQTRQLLEDFLENGGTQDELSLIDVLNHVTAEFIPSYVMTASGDFLRSHALPLVQKLTECSVSCCFRFYHSPETDCGHVFHVNVRHPLSQECNKAECDFFKSLAER